LAGHHRVQKWAAGSCWLHHFEVLLFGVLESHQSPFRHSTSFPASPTLSSAAAAKQDCVLRTGGDGEVLAGERELTDFTAFADAPG